METDKIEEDEQGRPTTSKFRSRRLLRSRRRSREAFAVTLNRFSSGENGETIEKNDLLPKDSWLKSSITNRKSTTPITLDMLFGDNFRAIGGFNNDGENPNFQRNPDEFSAKDKIYEEEFEANSTTKKESISQGGHRDSVSRISEIDNEDDISLKRQSFHGMNNYDTVNKNFDIDRNYQIDRAFKKKLPGFEVSKPNRSTKDQPRNIFFSTHVNMKVPLQKGTSSPAFYSQKFFGS